MSIEGLVETATMAAAVLTVTGMAAAGRINPLSGMDRTGMEWTNEEERFLRENAGRMPEDEICRRLGRSVASVKIHREREMHLVSPIKDPEYITGYRLAGKLGMNEPRKVSHWVRAGILDGEMVPYRDHDVSRVKIAVVLDWVVKPESWLYFHPERVADPNLKRLIGQAVEKWGDAWWSTNQAAEFHQVTNKDVLRAIKFQRVQALHLVNLSGRHQGGKWGFWFVLRSECLQWDRQAVFRKRGK